MRSLPFDQIITSVNKVIIGGYQVANLFYMGRSLQVSYTAVTLLPSFSPSALNMSIGLPRLLLAN